MPKITSQDLITLTLDTSEWIEKDGEKEAPTKDTWEKDGELYFTWDAAMREAKAQGMRLPTVEEWEELIRQGIQLPFAGYRKRCYYQRSDGYYWSSRQCPPLSYYAYFVSGSGFITDSYSRTCGFSVRCVRDTDPEADAIRLLKARGYTISKNF